MARRSAEKRYVAAEPRQSPPFARSRRLVLALAILVGLLALATLPARRHEADALLLARGDRVEVVARSYAEQIVDPSFLEQIRPRVRPIDGRRLTDEALRDSVSAQSVDGTGLVRLSARAGSAQGAEALANDVAVAFGVAVKQETQQHEALVRDELRSRVAERAREIARLRARASSAVVSSRVQELEAERKALVEQLAEASVLGARQSVGPTLVAAPHAALEPLLPRLLRRLVAGLLLGAVLGFVALGLLGLRGQRERRPRRVAIQHEPAVALPTSASLDWQLFDDLKPVKRTPSPDPEPAREPPPPQPVVRATVPVRPSSAPAPLTLVADPPLPPPAPADSPPAAPAPVAVLPRSVDMLELADLERLVVARPASDPYVQEERHALLVSLRGYTELDGVIPTRFHPLVQESFGDLLGGGTAVRVQG